MQLNDVQAYLAQHAIDGWLIYDFRGSNSVFSLLLGGQTKPTTRRALLWIPARGAPVLLASVLDANAVSPAMSLGGVPLRHERYISWRDLHGWMQGALGSCRRIAMEYAPGAVLPIVSIVDAGTIEFVRSLGVEVTSSADLLQYSVARWPVTSIDAHRKASALVAQIKDEAFAMIRTAHRAGDAINEYQVQQHIWSRMTAHGLDPDHPAIVGVNAHSGDPHFEVSSTAPSPIRPGDWVLIDLWARFPGQEHIFSDITWVGYCGAQVPARHREVFEVVKAARDASVRLARDAWTSKAPLQGWQLDDAARNVIIAAGFERFIKHRTGHSLSPGPKVHGLGFNLDNLETRDTRAVLAGLGYTIEPGIYTPEFGVRLEINVFTDPQHGPTITSCVQDDVVLMA